MNPHALFCLQLTCASRGLQNAGNIVVHDSLTQRYRCTTCGSTFTASKGTLFYRLKTDPKIVVQVLTLLAWGTPPQAIVAAYSLDIRTVRRWQEKAGQHCQGVHTALVTRQRLDLQHVQADEVRVKLQKGLVVWMAMALCVPTRLWLGGIVSPHRDKKLLRGLALLVQSCARYAALLLTSDGWGGYAEAWRNAFRTPLHTGQRGHPRLLPWPQVVIAQVVKWREAGRVVGVRVCHLRGDMSRIGRLLPAGQVLSTAYIERLNATFRARLCCLVRRTRALARLPETVSMGMYLVGCVYNFCTPHQSLSHNEPTTPAMAAGLTEYVWSLQDLLCFRITPPPLVAPKPRGRRPKAGAAEPVGGKPLVTV